MIDFLYPYELAAALLFGLGAAAVLLGILRIMRSSK